MTAALDGEAVAGSDDPEASSATAFFAHSLAGLVNGSRTMTGSSRHRSAWHYTYDVMGRQTTTVPPVNVTATDQNTSETVYEPGGRVAMTCSYPAGGSCAGTTSTRTWSPAYDAMGRVLTANLRENGTTRVTTTSTWNVDGQVASISENGDTLTYGYG